MGLNSSMRFSAKTLAAISQAVGEIYRPAARSILPTQIVRAIECVFGSDIVTYNELPADGRAPLIVSNNGFEKENGRLLRESTPYLGENPLVAKMMTNWGLMPTRISDVMPFKDYKRTTIYNEWYRPLEGDYQMACGFPAEESDTLLAIAVNQQRREFTDRELFLFSLLIPHIQQAYQISRAFERASGEAETARAALDAVGSAFIVFDDCYRVSTISAAAVRLISRFSRCSPSDGAQLPEDLRRYVQRLMDTSGIEVPSKRAPLRLVLDDGAKVTLRVSIDPERRRHCLVIESERGIPDEQALLALGLSMREAQVAYWTLQGKTNWEAGTILGISPRTVEKHIEKIYGKLGISERRHLRDRVDELRALNEMSQATARD